MHRLGRKTRSKTGCRTCRIRKVKCDEEKLFAPGQEEPQCRRCAAAQIVCEWKGGPIPRGPAKGSAKDGRAVTRRSDCQPVPAPTPSLSPTGSPGNSIQAANSLVLSVFDRSCLSYLQDSALVVILGKHWPWSTVSYAYHKIAVKEPMVMSMMLATTSSEINRSLLYDRDKAEAQFSIESLSDVDSRLHYGRALSGLQEALKQDVKSPEHIEAIFITLWMMIDYENRFGSGMAGINIHICGIESLLFNHVVPSLKQLEPPYTTMAADPTGITCDTADKTPYTSLSQHPVPRQAVEISKSRLRQTAVPLFLLWTLYFFTPGALLSGPGAARLDADLFRFFMQEEAGSVGLSLSELYRMGRQSPSRFWGEMYPTTAQLDDMENLPGLTLYHKSHVIQFRITELFRESAPLEKNCEEIIDELIMLSDEYDILLSSAKSAPSCEIVGDGRRVMETVFWAAITYYGTIVYLHLCCKDNFAEGFQRADLMSLHDAVCQVLELSLKLHRSRPHLMVRIIWPLFIAGIATSDRIYQDWVSIRLHELGRYGLNYSRVSARFDEIIQGGDPFAHGQRPLCA
ncbi:C6 zinc finger domain protein [Aspergillus sclerotioniger CBS 115572]|uniref:C6 zinc finger domain protein n=1 Tax=Aspergillus sclerotioniger CBS 115572 TaxID=1450535 RepID=A0A317W323_9EURO|nr:C6 zinc finger domain protein [Aspergillus sclerotioniger CBS 115572]PWY80903.1 C6 zinc finger domain protein [Aspergillus sclerotioniger CBS 115572]